MILGLGCLLGFTSCSDSWLNTDSTQTAGGDVDVYKRQTQANGLLLLPLTMYGTLSMAIYRIYAKCRVK